MKRVIGVLLLLAVPVLAQEKKEGGELTDPLEILKKADEATKAVNAVKYDGTYEGTGDSAAKLLKVEGKIVMDGELNGQPKRWLYEVKATSPGSADVKSYVAGSDGENYFVFDTAAKKAYQDIDPAVLGSTRRMIAPVVMREFVHPTPFQDEINGDRKELKGIVDVAGEKCYQIEVKYAGIEQVAMWYFSTKDFLPRQVERSERREGRRDDYRLTVRNLQVDPKLDDKVFKPEIPAGFEKIDDFAP